MRERLHRRTTILTTAGFVMSLPTAYILLLELTKVAYTPNAGAPMFQLYAPVNDIVVLIYHTVPFAQRLWAVTPAWPLRNSTDLVYLLFIAGIFLAGARVRFLGGRGFRELAASRQRVTTEAFDNELKQTRG